MSKPIIALLLGYLCASCGGGGGGGDAGGSTGGSNGGGGVPPPAPSGSEFSVSTTQLSFVADDFLSAARPQNVTGLVNTTATGNLYVIVEISGSTVQLVGPPNISGNTASATVYPADPSVLGVGTHTGTLKIRACMNSATCASGELQGSPRIVNVTYTVKSPVPVRDTVFPRFAISGRAGDIVIRGANFSGVTSVLFGTTAATMVTVVSATEIHARHPALPAGSQPITLNGGATPFTGTIQVIDPQTYAAATLMYPPPAPAAGKTQRPVYDPERQAIYLALAVDAVGPTYTPRPGRLLAYTHGPGGWSEAKVATIDGLRGVILGPTSSSLLGYTQDAILEIDPGSLAIQASYPLPSNEWPYPPGLEYIDHLALTNDGYAVVTFGCYCSGNERIQFFNTATHKYRLVQPNSVSPLFLIGSGGQSHRAYVSGDGGRVLIGTYAYDSSTGKMSQSPFVPGLRSNNVWPLIELDRGATRLIAIGTVDPQPGVSYSNIEVYDGSYQRLGVINEPTSSPVQDRHAVVSDDGKRLHVFHYDPTQTAIVAMSTFDISTPASPRFPLIGTRVTLPVMKHVNEADGVTLTPDGGTLLIAADNGLFVQPVP